MRITAVPINSTPSSKSGAPTTPSARKTLAVDTTPAQTPVPRGLSTMSDPDSSPVKGKGKGKVKAKAKPKAVSTPSAQSEPGTPRVCNDEEEAHVEEGIGSGCAAAKRGICA